MRCAARFLTVALAFAGAIALPSGAAGRAAAGRTASFHATIAYAVDGDTLRIREPGGELAYVRLVGIDTPEDVKPGYPSECASKAAARSMEALAPKAPRWPSAMTRSPTTKTSTGASSPTPSSKAAGSNSPSCSAAGRTSTATTTSASTA